MLGSKLKVVCFGYGGSVQHSESIRPIIEKLGMELVKISEWDDADIKYDPKTINDEIKKCDICILPCDHFNQPNKSSNRLLQAWSNKLPVVMSPLQSYLDLLGDGKQLLAPSDDENWKETLIFFLDEENRKYYGSLGYDIAQKFSPQKIADKWIDVLSDVTRKSTVDLIIPSYNNLEYLKLTVAAIELNTNNPYRLYIVDSSTNGNVKKYLETVGKHTVIHCEGKTSFSKAVNIGIEASKNEYFVIMNNDLVPTKNWLTNLLKYSDEDTAAVGPLSNCDRYWLNDIKIDIKGVELKPNMVIEDFDDIDDLLNLKTFLNGKIEPTNISNNSKENWLAMYCTLISRDVWDKVGRLDEGYVNGGEDKDWMIRAYKMGYKVYQSYDSYVFHFGGKTRKISEAENPDQHIQEDTFNNQKLSDKFSKPLCCIYLGRAWEKWDYSNLNNGGIGGSETWAIHLSRELSNLGYCVKIFADPFHDGTKDGEYDVVYHQWGLFDSFRNENYIDYFISSRTTDPFYSKIRSGINLCMVHDIWLSQDKNHPLFLDKIDYFLCLSEWHVDFFSQHHGVPKEKILLTSNGVDLSRFDNSVEKNKHSLIYSSSPDRGLWELLDIFDDLKKQIPDLTLDVFYGFDNWIKSAKAWDNKEVLAHIENFKERLETTEGVIFHGRTSQKELGKFWNKAGVWCYISEFSETFCITALEAMASKTPIICSDNYGLQTTVKDAGILVEYPYEGYTKSPAGKNKFKEELLRILNDENLYLECQNKGTARVSKFTWENVAKQFDNYFKNKKWEIMQ